MKQRDCRLRTVAVSAAILIAMIAGTIRPALSEQLLSGGVQHSEKLPPVQTFQIGTQYNQQQAMASVTPTRVWYRVPPWMAGEWTDDKEATQTFYLDYATGKQDTSSTQYTETGSEGWGIQRDREGGIWDAIDLPFASEETTAKHLLHDLHTGDALILDSALKLVLMLRYTRTRVDSSTNTITDVEQIEEFDTYSLAGPNLLRVEYSQKHFDHQGNPVGLYKGWWTEHKTGPAGICNFNNGEDSGPDFRAYLKNHGLDNLIPLEQQ